MCISPILIKNKKKGKGRNEFTTPVPCGKCAKCVRRRVSSWLFRLQQEEKISSSAYFLTLTYDDKYVPKSIRGYSTLDKRDVQLYFKTLRNDIKKNYPSFSGKIVYYAVGEYGSITARPHYHAIVFNVPSEEIFINAWRSSVTKESKGFVKVGRITGARVSYTLKYISKEAKPKEWYKDRQREFSLMSKGIGKNYLTEATVRYHKGDISMSRIVLPGGYKIPLPRYFKNKIYSEDELRAINMFLSQKIENEEVKALDDFLLKNYKKYPVKVLLNEWDMRQRNAKFDKRNEVL